MLIFADMLCTPLLINLLMNAMAHSRTSLVDGFTTNGLFADRHNFRAHHPFAVVRDFTALIRPWHMSILWSLPLSFHVNFAGSQRLIFSGRGGHVPDIICCGCFRILSCFLYLPFRWHLLFSSRLGMRICMRMMFSLRVDVGVLSMSMFGGVMISMGMFSGGVLVRSMLGGGVLGSSMGVCLSILRSIRLSVCDMHLIHHSRIHPTIVCVQVRRPAPIVVRFTITSGTLSLSRCSHHLVLCGLYAHRARRHRGTHVGQRRRRQLGGDRHGIGNVEAQLHTRRTSTVLVSCKRRHSTHHLQSVNRCNCIIRSMPSQRAHTGHAEAILHSRLCRARARARKRA